MKRLSKSIAAVAVSVLMSAELAHAIPVPTIGSELGTQMQQLQQYLKSIKDLKAQIENGVQQAKSMGDNLSMDGLKNVGKGLKATGVSAMKIHASVKKIGFSEDTLQDPEKNRDVIEKWHEKSISGNFSQQERNNCLTARRRMTEELSTAGLSNSLAAQQKLVSGESMKNAQQAVNSVNDQMQLLGGNTAMLKLMYAQMTTTTALDANRMASTAVAGLCD